MTDDPLKLGRTLVLIANLLDEFDSEAFNYGGIVRRAARALAELAVPEEGACPVCGGPVEQPARGKRRTYCGSRCRWRAGNRRREDRESTS